MRKFRLGPAAEAEPLVFGAQGPAYSSLRINEWIAYMQEQGIQRVCCLLHEEQLKAYKEDLLAAYGQAFGQENVCWAPIPDYHLCDVGLLKARILPFLKESAAGGSPVVVHCQGGRGRAGHVLAAWLVCGRGLAAEDAVAAVKVMGRNPHEAADWGNAKPEDLYMLLEACQEGPMV
ncbi:MAG: dual specificity protein phosphatase family protein [Deltaproteobacteria bacterium]|nr:dual specificity protein phosphatase family protein [Deltaproteobacteria bacterium]